MTEQDVDKMVSDILDTNVDGKPLREIIKTLSPGQKSTIYFILAVMLFGSLPPNPPLSKDDTVALQGFEGSVDS